MRELDETDCQELLSVANKKIKVISQLLDRLIPEDDSHTVIHEKKPNEVEAIPGNMMTYKVPVKGCISPAKFYFSYGNQLPEKKGVKPATRLQVHQDLQVFVSLEEKEPNVHNCTWSYISPDNFLV